MLYLIKSSNYLKIGSTNNIKQRIIDYNTHNPDFKLLATREGGLEEEKILQNLFKDRKHRGEWFKYSITIVNTFNTYQFNEDSKLIKTKQNFKPKVQWIYNTLIEQKKSSFTYSELEELFTPLFEEHGLEWNKNTSIKTFFPDFTKKKRMVNKKRETYYYFNL